MSCPPPSTDDRFGLKETRPVDLRLVKGPDTKPCPPELFPFWLSVVLATVVLAAGALGARCWLIPILALQEDVRPPTVQIREAELWEEETDPLPRVARLDPAHPFAPRLNLPVPIPAVQPEELVRADWSRPIEEPYDPPEASEEADLPFPTAQEEPMVAKSTPKKTPLKSTRRPTPRPESPPKAVARGESSPARILRRYNPPYPISARRAGTEGRVVLTVQVRSDGRVGSVRVATSSGSAVLDSAAISAVKRWSFAPELRDGQKVGATVNVPFRFVLN